MGVPFWHICPQIFLYLEKDDLLESSFRVVHKLFNRAMQELRAKLAKGSHVFSENKENPFACPNIHPYCQVVSGLCCFMVSIGQAMVHQE